MQNSNVVMIKDAFGNENAYRLASARFKEMLEEFPLPEYRIRISSEPSLDPDSAKVLTAMIEKGVDFSPFFQAYKIGGTKITAQLLNNENEVIAEGSSVRCIIHNKDYEIGETAALQRLLVSMGRHGSLMDDDESKSTPDNSEMLLPSQEDVPSKAVAEADAPEEVAQEKPEPKAKSKVSPSLMRSLNNLVAKAEKAGIEVDYDIPETQKEATKRIQALQAKLREKDIQKSEEESADA